MKKKIKIALPTDDGLAIVRQFGYPKGFLVATVLCGKIVRQEMRRNLLSEILTSEHGMYYNLCDCQVVIVNEIGNCNRIYLQSKKKEVFLTKETMISNALIMYLEKLSLLIGSNAI